MIFVLFFFSAHAMFDYSFDLKQGMTCDQFCGVGGDLVRNLNSFLTFFCALSHHNTLFFAVFLWFCSEHICSQDQM